jgi:hypothetical protein
MKRRDVGIWHKTGIRECPLLGADIPPQGGDFRRVAEVNWYGCHLI